MGFTLNIMGGNMYVWKQKHNENHHTFTNIEGHDDDINLKPFLRMHEGQQKLWIHRYQHFYGVFMYGMSLMFWVFYQDFKRYFSGQIAEHTNMRKMKTSDHLIFWSSKFLHILLFLLIPMYTVGVLAAIVGYITMSYVCGIILGIVFQMAHVVEPTSFVTPSNGIESIEDEWAVHQIKTTFDFATKNKVVCWLLGGLNFQVEHHLFPRVSHVHYPALRKIVRDTCDEFSIRYHEFPTVLKAFRSHLSYLRTIGRA
jgi:linoleoyl-CoA desaturase